MKTKIKRLIKPKSIYLRLITLVLFSILTISTIISSFYIYFNQKSILEMEYAILKEISNSIKGDLAYYIALNKLDSIAKLLNSYIGVANIAGIFLAKNKKIITSVNINIDNAKEILDQTTETKTKHKNFLVYRIKYQIKIPKPIPLEETLLRDKMSYKTYQEQYFLFFLIPWKKIEKQIYQTTCFSLATSVIITIIATFLTFIIARKIILPLKEITTKIHKISFGELQELEETFFKNDLKEIVDLAKSFNHMVQALKNKELEVRKEIQGYIKELEIKNKELENAIHKLKESQEQLIQTEKLAGLGILTAGIAHEINNPLQVIAGFCELLLQEVEDEKTKDRLLKIKKHVDNIKNIVNALSEYSRKDNIFEELDIKTVINDAIETVKLAKKYKNIKFIKQFDSQEYKIYGTKTELQQVFVNLFINAAQAMNGKGEIFIFVNKTEDFVRILIKDSGPGIPAHIKKHIFDPFFTTKEPGQGTGLGLNIVYRILTKHHGNIRVLENDPGAVFEIILPSMQN